MKNWTDHRIEEMEEKAQACAKGTILENIDFPKDSWQDDSYNWSLSLRLVNYAQYKY